MDLTTPSANSAIDAAAPAMRRYAVEELKAAVLAKLTYSVGKNRYRRQPARLVSRGRVRHPRHHRRALDRIRPTRLRRRPQARLLSVAGVSHRPHAVRRDDQSGRRRADDRGAFASSASIWRRLRRRRIGRRARQRRPRPAGRLLHGQHGDAVDRRLRLRHSLRQRPVPPDHPQRLATGDSRGLAHPRQSLGIRTAGSQLRDRLRRLGRGGARRRREASATSGIPARRSKRSATTRRSSAGAARHVNTLRLWSARAPDPLKLDAFNAGDYIGALADSVRAEAISKVLYPSDATPAGQELRLRQEYFFASASLLDLVRRHVKQHSDIRTLAEHVGDPAQRHPSGDRRRRIDAHPRRPEPASIGTRPGRSRRRCSPTPTIRCCPRRWRAGRCR